MEFCIDKSVLGTEKHFHCSFGQFRWISELQSGVWTLSSDLNINNDFCLNTLARLNDIDLNLKPPAKFVAAIQTVMSGSNITPPWQYVMPTQSHREFMKNIMNQVTDVLTRSSQDYYKTIWVPGNAVLNSLKRAKINSARYSQLIEARKGNMYALQSFKPQQGGYADSVVYNRFGTRTGRITIESGPSILTLKKEQRNLIESRYGSNGKIVAIDFANLEPRVLLYEAGKRCDDPDLYSVLNMELFHGSGDRKIVKGAVISELYGTSKYTLQKKLNKPIEVIDQFVHRISGHFQTKNLLVRIKEQFVKEGYILNRFGRRVLIDQPVDRIFINSYAQSTGVDIAMLGFNHIIKMVEGRKIIPIFLLVDALLLDVHDSEIEFLKSIKSVKVHGYVQSFPLTFDIIS